MKLFYASVLLFEDMWTSNTQHYVLTTASDNAALALLEEKANFVTNDRVLSLDTDTNGRTYSITRPATIDEDGDTVDALTGYVTLVDVTAVTPGAVQLVDETFERG